MQRLSNVASRRDQLNRDWYKLLLSWSSKYLVLTGTFLIVSQYMSCMTIGLYIAILSPLPGSFSGPNTAAFVEDKGQCGLFCYCFLAEVTTTSSGPRKAGMSVKGPEAFIRSIWLADPATETRSSQISCTGSPHSFWQVQGTLVS